MERITWEIKVVKKLIFRAKDELGKLKLLEKLFKSCLYSSQRFTEEIKVIRKLSLIKPKIHRGH